MQNLFPLEAYTYNDDKARTLLLGLSSERLSRYSELAPNNNIKQLQLYAWNTALSESMYTPIQGLEIITRNHFNMALAKGFGEEWYANHKIQFTYAHALSLSQARDTLLKDRKLVTPSNLISTLSFGFWTGLLGSKYETSLWRNCIYRSFINKPSPFLRKNAHYEFDLIRILRNRIAHHEPILRPDLPNHHSRIIKMMKYFCEETANWIKAQSRFDDIWRISINPFLR